MTVNFKEKFKCLYERIKKVKHIEIYLAVGLAVIVTIIYFAFVSTPNSSSNNNSTNDDNVNLEISSSQEYVNYLENKLESVITNVKGVGEVNVIITLEKGFEYIYVTEDETRTTSNGTTITTSTIILVDGQPVLQEEIYPIIKGVVVVAEGASDINVKMNILTIVQTVIDIDNSKINIIVGN